MQVIYDISTMRELVSHCQKQGKSIALVPTMGALHEGHLTLLKSAKDSCDVLICSIFVNKKQFDDPNDFIKYPRNLANDLQTLSEVAPDYVFAPVDSEMWPDETETIVETEKLAHILIGKTRPGHFRGVTTVVAKLFNIIKPNKAFFGEKDFQQLTIIKRMVEDLAFDVDIVGVPIVRESDGLAYSSRNQLLLPEYRKAAVVLYQSLKLAQKLFDTGVKSVALIEKAIKEHIQSKDCAKIENIDILDSKTLNICQDSVNSGDVILLCVRFGDVLLLDQYILV